MKITTGGSVAISALAILMPNRVPTSTPPISAARPAGKVRVESLFVTMNGHTKLFQLAMKVKMETVVRAVHDRSVPQLRGDRLEELRQQIEAEGVGHDRHDEAHVGVGEPQA